VRLFLLLFLGTHYYVEAASMEDAIAIWRDRRRTAEALDWDEGPASCEHVHPYPVIRAQADERFLAAGPDLLQFAVEADNWFDNHGSEDDEGAMLLLAMARRAIAKTERPAEAESGAAGMSDQTVGRIEQLTHTPGIWSVERGIHDYDVVAARKNRAVARLAGYILSKADADLMAAAPDLFAALRRMLDCHQAGMDAAFAEKRCECGACDEARAAVAKAEGRS
jgi:hypothetical protein